ncbi:hypothetical protein [Thiorhodovibrio frisius]|uniref:Uncharacterized protein n=1 Tax=Thiorhodovibrio frisius TaxID=631362 RepID=H8YX96_9GAMM|nr:hypothetical protein [Thiorhodovibrio frisius]EIC23072.1 hypothetical protein Thi970DRAFT_00723 [Thiorhodovibrio frisius]WPL22663.1 hypothetical protein Thiofri_02833 [Thiorhodovibrio frisius]
MQQAQIFRCERNITKLIDLRLLPVYAALLLGLCVGLTGNVMAQELSADDFLSPVAAATPAEAEELTTIEGPVQEIDDSVTGEQVVQAETAQDAINYVVNQRSVGAEMMRFGSGIGWVATGQGSYEVMENPTATRIAKRNAYVRAFMEAKAKLAEALDGLSSEGQTVILEAMESETNAAADLANFTSTQEEKLEQAVQMLLKGFVVYSVEDNTESKQVFVSIVTTPKTRGQFNRPTGNGLEATSVREGLDQVLTEIKNGLVPPVGGRIISVPATGEMAFVGFGSDVVRTSSNASLQAKQKLNAQKIANMRASDALVGLLIGDDTSWKSKLDDQTQQIIAEFEDSEGESGDVTRERFEQARTTFVNTQASSEEFRSLRRGVLPPGVQRKSFASPDEAEVYALAVYIPSITKMAADTAKEMGDAQLIQPLQTVTGGSGSGETGKTTNPAAGSPPATILQGPTGQIHNDQDL